MAWFGIMFRNQQDFFADYFVQYFYFLLSLQAWVFGVKYLESACNCSLTFVNPNVIPYTLWSGIFIYTSTILGLLLGILIASDGTQLFNKTQENIYNATSLIWLAFNVISTVITITAIRQIFKTIRILNLSNSNVDINTRTLVIHSTLLSV